MALMQLNDKLLKDDYGSNTSSVANKIVEIIEDSDELRLGAEANSFERTTSKEESKSSVFKANKYRSQKDRCCNDNLIIMKQIHCSMENLEIDVKYSAISSVMDILDARECDPDEILASLGFGNYCDEVNKRDILSRFKASSLLNNEDSQFLDVMLNNRAEHHNHIRPQYKDSIHKAEEWLTFHHNDNNKDKIESCKSGLNAAIATNSGSKKPSVGWLTKRKKFLKSRQSSFELLLPNLTEEDNQSDASATKTRDLSSSPSHPTIRESSLELPQFVENYPKKKHLTNESIPHSTLPDDLSLITTESIDTDPQSVQLHTTHEHKDTHVQHTEAHDENRALTRLLKSSLLIAHQRDSFELEEINSCNGDPIESSRHRRPGVAFLTIDSFKRNGTEPSHSPNSEECSDENESSSGFGEDEVLNSTSYLPGQCRHHVSPHTVVESIQRKRGSPTSLSSPVSTHYVYDVKLGHRFNATPIADKAEPNLNNNCRGASFVSSRFDKNRQKSQSSSALLRSYVPLRRSDSLQGFGKVPNGFIVTPLSNATDINSNSEQNGIGKSRSFFSDARRRRKEFAERSALSGDSITELVSTALVRHGSNFVLKKRRPGHYRYYSSTNDLFAKHFDSSKHDFQRINSMDSNHRIAFKTGDCTEFSYKSRQYGGNQYTTMKQMQHSRINGAEKLRANSNPHSNAVSVRQMCIDRSVDLDSTAVSFRESTNYS